MSPSAGTVFFVAGLMSAGYFMAGAFFLRFWWRRRDPLFVGFAIAFWLMALNQAVAAYSRVGRAENSAAYVLRLLAFAIIIIAVLGKNRGRNSSR